MANSKTESANSWLKLLVLYVSLLTALVVHEYGHYTAMIERGWSVKEFSIGYGPALYQYVTDNNVTFSLRAIPLMAYVELTELGALQLDQGHPWDRLMVVTAGMRNNYFFMVLLVLYLQLLGWYCGNISLRQLAAEMLWTPIRVLQRLGAFFLSLLTFGRVELGGRYLFNSGGVQPSVYFDMFVLWNAIMASLNLMPIPLFDGLKVADAVIDMLWGVRIPPLPVGIFLILMILYILLTNRMNLQLFAAGHSENVPRRE